MATYPVEFHRRLEQKWESRIEQIVPVTGKVPPPRRPNDDDDDDEMQTVPKSIGGPWVGGRPRVLITIGPSSKRCKQMTPLTVRQPLHCHAARLGRCIDAHRTSVRHPAPCASVPPDPTQLPAKRAFFVIAITQRAQWPS